MFDPLDDLTVGTLRQILANQELSDDTPVGVNDYYGRFIQFGIAPKVEEILHSAEVRKVLVFPSIDIGPEPD